MLFTDLANAWERSRLGDRSLSSLDFNEESTALYAYEILFSNETLTERKVLSKVANELEVPYEIVLELLDKEYRPYSHQRAVHRILAIGA